MFTILFPRMIREKGWIFFWCCVACIFGIGAASFLFTQGDAAFEFWLYAIVGSSFLAILLFSHIPLVRFLLLLLLFFSFGMWRFLVALPHDPLPSELRFWNGESARISGIVAQDVDMREKSQRVTIAVDHLSVSKNNPSSARGGKREAGRDFIVSGKLLLSLGKYPEIRYGDRVAFSCALEAPEPFNDFAYDRYLARFGVFTTCAWPKQLTIMERGKGNRVFATLFSIKRSLAESLATFLPEPHGALTAGIVLGAKKALPQELLDSFTATGLTHIIVVSGMHMLLFAQILGMILVACGFWPKTRFIVTTVVLVLFVAMIGFPPSAVRGATFAIVLSLAFILGRLRSMANVLACTALVMLVVNPMLLRFDVGFQLSFLASIGLVYVMPILKTWAEPLSFVYHYLPSRLVDVLRMIVETIVVTFSAMIATTPLMMMTFGRISLVAPLTNLLVIPVIPWITMLGFATAIIGSVSQFFGTVFGVMLGVFSSYILFVVQTFSQFSFSSMQVSSAPAWFVLVLYMMIAVWIIRWQWKRIHFHVTPPNPLLTVNYETAFFCHPRESGGPETLKN